MSHNLENTTDKSAKHFNSHIYQWRKHLNSLQTYKTCWVTLTWPAYQRSIVPPDPPYPKSSIPTYNPQNKILWSRWKAVWVGSCWLGWKWQPGAMKRWGSAATILQSAEWWPCRYLVAAGPAHHSGWKDALQSTDWHGSDMGLTWVWHGSSWKNEDLGIHRSLK